MNIDQKVMALVAKVNEKKAEIKAAERPCWETNLSFGYVEDSPANRVAINVTTKVNELVSIVAFLNGKERDFKAAAEELGVKAKFTWMNFTKDQWINDCKTRVGSLLISEKKKELDKLEERVNSLITPEQRRQLELEKLEKELL